MCYEASFRSDPVYSTEQRQEGLTKARLHHELLSRNVRYGVPGAKEAYEAHIAKHVEDAKKAVMNGDSKGDIRALRALTAELKQAEWAARKHARSLALTPNEELREVRRAQRIARRAKRRDDPEATAAVEAAERLLRDCRSCAPREVSLV